MMMIDTHALVKEIVALGVDEKKAEFAISKFVSMERFIELEKSVVKPSEFKEAITLLRNDIVELRNEQKLDIAELKTEIANTKYEIIKWLGGLIISVAAVMVYFIKG